MLLCGIVHCRFIEKEPVKYFSYVEFKTVTVEHTKLYRRTQHIMLFEQEANDLQVNDVVMQEPAPSPIDSDYFSETDEDSPVDGQEENNPSDPVVCSVSDDWIELDLSMDSLRSLGFLSDTDFQAVLESFAEFTSHQLRLGVSSPREMEGLLRNHFAYLLWRRTVFTKLRQLPPVTAEAEQLNHFLGNKWYEDTEMMADNRERFKSLVDATTVPQLIISTIQSYFRKRQPERTARDVVYQNKRPRRN
ncbi:hypothetical protein OUZ56_007014 [Daphnia magna]|uniref:Uncharacterized protein n=2 Tax=Daphnia magna TaxID=35525 RepID=A0ABQ9YXC2_9CRUS|nr:hypothetical protein OUZ56_007014 [Daphnia magna]